MENIWLNNFLIRISKTHQGNGEYLVTQFSNMHKSESHNCFLTMRKIYRQYCIEVKQPLINKS